MAFLACARSPGGDGDIADGEGAPCAACLDAGPVVTGSAGTLDGSDAPRTADADAAMRPDEPDVAVATSDAAPGMSDAHDASNDAPAPSQAQDASGWIDMNTGSSACDHQNGVSCGWNPTNNGAGYTCACRHGTWADGWTCEPAGAPITPGASCP